MRVAFVTSECVPFVKTGGLADVSGALPKALERLGCEVKIFLPLYQSIDAEQHRLVLSHDLDHMPVHLGGKTEHFNAWYGRLPGSNVDVHFVDCPHYFHRKKLYTNDPDEDERFSFFQHAVFQIIQRYHWAPDVIHANDWQAALMPVLLKDVYEWDQLFSGTGTLLSIHNIGYQGRFSKHSIGRAGLGYANYYPEGPFEYFGDFSFLKAGILYADRLSTVSQTYANEILLPEYGAGLHEVLRTRSFDLYGVLNGIDTEEWSPAKDKFIPENYTFRTLAKKAVNRTALLEQTGLPEKERHAVIGIVSRFAVQKGFELLQPVIHDIMRLPVQLVVLGSGDPKLEDFFRSIAHAYPERVASIVAYSNELAHLITAGADMFLMPSRYEPCGLNQMYSLNYGTVPIVRKTGGLADTVHDFHESDGEGNGFSFRDFSSYSLYVTIERALKVFEKKKMWKEIQARGMKADFTWDASARKYLRLYEMAVQVP